MTDEIGPFDPGPFIKSTLELLQEEFGPGWWDCPYANRMGVISFSVFEEKDIIKHVPIFWVDSVLEFKKHGTFEGKPLAKDFGQTFIKKLMRGPDLEE